MNILKCNKLEGFLRGYSRLNLNILAKRMEVSEETLIHECRAQGFTVGRVAGTAWVYGRPPRVWCRDKDGTK